MTLGGSLAAMRAAAAMAAVSIGDRTGRKDETSGSKHANGK